MISLCVAGCGGWTRRVMEYYPGITGDVELYFASREADKAREYCDEYGGAGYFGSYEEAAADPRVDALYFVTPHHGHPDNVRLAAAASKHVLVEKPIARTMPEGREMVHAARNAGVKLMIAENYRFLNAVRRCKELMAGGAIGDLKLIESHRVFRARDVSGWRTSLSLRGGGILIDAGIHAVDIMVNLAGLPASVYAAKPPVAISVTEGDDGAVVTAALPGGVVGLLCQYGGSDISDSQDWVHVTGSKGELRFQPHGKDVVLDTANGKQVFPVSDDARGLDGMIREFRDSVLEDREPVMTGEEGLKDLAVVLAADESAEKGLPAAIPWP